MAIIVHMVLKCVRRLQARTGQRGLGPNTVALLLKRLVHRSIIIMISICQMIVIINPFGGTLHEAQTPNAHKQKNQNCLLQHNYYNCVLQFIFFTSNLQEFAKYQTIPPVHHVRQAVLRQEELSRNLADAHVQK